MQIFPHYLQYKRKSAIVLVWEYLIFKSKLINVFINHKDIFKLIFKKKTLKRQSIILATTKQALMLKAAQGHFLLRFRTIHTWRARAARFHMLIIKSGALRQGLGSARKHQNRGVRAGESKGGVNYETVRKCQKWKKRFRNNEVHIWAHTAMMCQQGVKDTLWAHLWSSIVVAHFDKSTILKLRQN